MKRLVLNGFGRYLSKEHRRFAVKKDGNVVARAVPSKTRQIIFSGNCGMSSNALVMAADNDVDVVFIDNQGKLRARFGNLLSKDVFTRRAQYLASLNKKGVFIAKKFIISKIKNQNSLLATAFRSRLRSDSSLQDSFSKILNANIDRLAMFEADCSADGRGFILGCEGSASAVYWKTVGSLILPKYDFKGRSGRGAKDPINAMLNYGYGVLLSECTRATVYAGLDPYSGFLHADGRGRLSFVYDFMELFRQQFVDKTVFSFFSKGKIDFKSFETKNDVCYMPDKLRIDFLKALLEKLEREIEYEGKSMKFCEIIENEAVKIAKFLKNETRTYSSFHLRW